MTAADYDTIQEAQQPDTLGIAQDTLGILFQPAGAAEMEPTDTSVTLATFGADTLAEPAPAPTVQSSAGSQSYISHTDTSRTLIADKADTLAVRYDTLSAEESDTSLYDAEKSFSTDFFNDSTLLQSELDARTNAPWAEILPYTLWRDNMVGVTMLLSLALFVYTINSAMRPYVLQIKSFTYTPRSTDTPFAKDIAFGTRAIVSMTLLISLLCGFIVYTYTQGFSGQSLSVAQPYIILLAYMGCFLIYFIFKRLAYRFTDWVFFAKQQHKLWADACSLALCTESLLFFPATLALVYLDIDISQILTALFCIILLCKILLAYKCFSIFFPKIHCILHYFVYLCALEIVPLIALWKFLAFIDGFLIAKY